MRQYTCYSEALGTYTGIFDTVNEAWDYVEVELNKTPPNELLVKAVENGEIARLTDLEYEFLFSYWEKLDNLRKGKKE